MNLALRFFGNSLQALALIAVVLLASWNPAFGQPALGEAPTAPSSIAGLPGGGIRLQSVTGGFEVDTSSREQVRSFYNGVYTASEDVPMDSSSDVANCVSGTNSTAFVESVLRRINWYRAMAGVPASVTFTPTLNDRCQQAAVIMSRNNALTHFPDTGWLCFTGDGASAASNSNLALGYAGAHAITAYIWDFGAHNEVVGHRRWILHPQTQVMGTGDVPGQDGQNAPANATWVFDANMFGPRPATRDPHVAWPPAGFVPYTVVYPRWSLSLSNANLSAATVLMTRDGMSIPTAIEPYEIGVGENTLVWVPLGLDPNGDALFPFEGGDTTYNVTVTNIQVGEAAIGISYSVTIFDPAVPGQDHVPPAISGPTQPGVGLDNPYSFNAVPGATGYQWRAALRTLFNFSDGAEGGLGNFAVDTTPGYPVWISAPVASGSRAFNLQHPEPARPQTLTLNQDFRVRTNTVLTFRSRLTWATVNETARVQISTNGNTWFDLYTQAGAGGEGEGSFTARTVPLGSAAGHVARLRFNYDFSSGTYYLPEAPGHGWVIDNIVLTNAELFTVLGVNDVASTGFTFTPSQPGLHSLQVREIVYGGFPLDWGPEFQVEATTNLPPIIRMGQPVVSNGEVRLDFTLESGAAGSFTLLEADQFGATWVTNTVATLSTNTGGSYRFTTTTGRSARYYRVQTP